MRHQQADYTLTFRKLAEAVEPGIGEAGFAACFGQPDSTSEWLARWRTRLARQSRSTMEAAQAMRLANPAFIPRNHRIEQAIAAALEGDLSKFHEMVDVLARPFDDQLERARLAPLLREAMAKRRVAGEFFDGRWTDVGTPQRLSELDAELRQATGTGLQSVS